MHVKEIVYCGFFSHHKSIPFIFLKIYVSVNMPEIVSSFTTCISMLWFLTHWILTFILWWLSPLVFSFLFFLWRVSIKTTYIFLLCIYFFLWIISMMKFIFYWYIRNPPLYLSIAVWKMIIRNSIVFSLTLRTSVVFCIFFITFIKFKNCSTCILILLLKYNRIS